MVYTVAGNVTQAANALHPTLPAIFSKRQVRGDAGGVCARVGGVVYTEATPSETKCRK